MQVAIFERATLKPILRAGVMQYDLVVSNKTTGAWGRPGRYPTPDAALDTSDPPLKEFLKASIRLRVYRGESVTFSLMDAFEEL